MFRQRFQNEPVTTDPRVEEDTTEIVTYEVANMAEEDNTFHLTYEDGKAVTFQVYDDNITDPTSVETDSKACSKEMLRKPKNTTATSCHGTEHFGKENEAQAVDEESELWELYMKTQYTGYKDREMDQEEESKEADILDQGNIKLDQIDIEEVNMGQEEEVEIQDLLENDEEEGLLQAKELANKARKNWIDRAALYNQTSSSSSSSTSKRTESEYTEEGVIEQKDEEYDDEGKVILLRTGPFRWTPVMITSYMKQYTHMEGKLWVHPRTKRLYEITNVFFYEKEQVAAAYSKVRDGGQADITDHFPHRIEGKLGLAELIEEFEKGGGSLGNSRTAWPTTEEDWAALQEEDALWGPIVSRLKIERKEALEALPPAPQNKSSKEEKRLYETAKKEIKVYGKERGRVLVYDGVLFVEPLDNRHRELLYVVPQCLKLNICEQYHDSRGHPGAERTTDTARGTFWWYGMVNDIEKHVQNCKACARRKARNAVPAVPIQQYDSPTMPWQRVHIDLTGPLTVSHLGNAFIVVIKDALTRYTETIAVKKNDAQSVAYAFIHSIIYRHGAVEVLISDNGREFVNKLWRQVAQLLNIKHITITTYNPRANGLAENHMRPMKDAISIYCDESQKDWDLHLHGITMSYNTTVNTQTGFTPYYMMYGREARMPNELWLRAFSQARGVLPFVTKMVNVLTKVWETAEQSKPKEVARMIAGVHPKTHLKFVDYKVGDFIMMCVVPKPTTLGWIEAKHRKVNLKLQPRYAGPYQIVKWVSPVVYIIKVDGTNRVIHAINMKPYLGKKDALTPYVEPGYELMEGSSLRKPATPLLLSPIPALNEKSTSQFKKKNPSAQNQQTERWNAARDREQRERDVQYTQSQSQSQNSGIFAHLTGNEDLDENDPSENHDEYRDPLHFGVDAEEEVDDKDEQEESRTEYSEDSGEDDNLDPDGFPYEEESDGNDKPEEDPPLEESTNLSEVVAKVGKGMVYQLDKAQTQLTHPNTHSTEEAVTRAARWTSRIGDLHNMTNEEMNDVLYKADIKPIDLHDDPARKLRIENWLTKIVPKELARERDRHRLTAKQRQKGRTITIPVGEIGRILSEKDTQWYESLDLNKTGLVRPLGYRHITNSVDGLSIEELSGERLPEEGAKATTEAIIEETNVSIIEVIPPKALATTTCYNVIKVVDGLTKAYQNEPYEKVKVRFYNETHGMEIAKNYLRNVADHVFRTLSVAKPSGWEQALKQTDSVSYLRHESLIPVPPALRTLRLKLMYQIRRFPFNGLLAPVKNNNIADDERFCNHHPECISTVTSRVFHHFMAKTQDDRNIFFSPYEPPKSYIQRRLRIHPYHTEDDAVIRQTYDIWYWSLFNACSIEMECEVPLIHVVDMVHKAIFDVTNRDSVFRNSAHLHEVYDAMQRNIQLNEAPEWVKTRNHQG